MMMGEAIALNWWAAMFCLAVMGTTENQTVGWVAVVAFAINLAAWIRTL
jgi:hypothetical protein